MSLRTALAFAGGAIGAIVGGPAGARWGFMIGSTIGSLVDPQTIQGPKIGEIANQTAQEGGPRPIVFVRSPPMPGNVIDQSDVRIVKKKSGGKGGPKTVTEQAFRTYAIGVCEGPISGFRRIWRNNVLVYDNSEDPQVDADANAAFLTKARFFLGTFDQDASPDLEAIHGAGTTPSYRGTAYMVMADEDLTDLRGAIPQWIFEVASGCVLERVVFTETGVWNRPEGVTNINLFMVGPGGVGRGNFGTSTAAAGAPGGGGEVFYEVGVDVSAADQWRMIVDRSDLVPGGAANSPTRFGHGDPSVGTFVEIRNAKVGGQAYPVDDPDGSGASGAGGGRAIFINAADPPTHPDRYIDHQAFTDPGAATVPGQFPGGASTFIAFPNPHTAPYTDFGAVSGGGGGAGSAGQDATSAGPGRGGDGKYMGHIVGDDLGEGGFFGGGGGGAAAACLYNEDLGPQIAQGAVGGLGGGGNGAGTGFTLVGGVTVGMPGTGGGGGGYNLASYGSFVPGGSGVGVILYCPSGANNLSLKDTIIQICARAGLPSSLVDVSLLPDVNLNGLAVTNQYTAGEILRTLGQAYLFDPSPRDGKVWFIPRGGDHVATITIDDLVDEDDEEEDDRRDDSISVPRVLHLNYWDTAGGLATSQQSSERSGDRRSVGETSIQTSVLMTADQAAQNVVVNHKVLAENQRGSVNLTLPDKWIGLRIADPIIAEVGDANRRLMIQKMSILDGYQKYEATYDRQSAYTSNVEGIPAVPQTPPPTSNVGPTLIIPLDIPLLRDSDDTADLSYYVAVAGISPAWSGALIEISYDGGANYIDSQEATASSTIGNLKDELPDHPKEFPDTVHSFSVAMATPDSELEDTDLAGMQNRKNLAAIGSPSLGWELVNFANVEETTADEWLISYLLRGRKDTETRLHNAGEYIVMLDRSILGFVPSAVTDLNRTLTFRATSLGAPVETGTVVSMFYTGKSQTERHVGYLSGRFDGDNLIIEWQGVARLGGGGSVAHGSQFNGYRVTFDDGVNPPIVVDTDNQTVTQDVSTLGDDITVTVVQLNNLTGEGPPSYWPEAPDTTGGGGSEEIPQAYLWTLGGETPFGIGGILVNKMIFDDADPQYYIDMRYIVTAGLDYSLHYYPPDAVDIDDREAVLAIGDQVWGITRHPTDPERIYWSDGTTAYYANVREHVGGGSPVIAAIAPFYSGIHYDGGELLCFHYLDPSDNFVSVLDPDTMVQTRELALGSILPFKYVSGTDASAPNSLWICTYGDTLVRIDRTTGVIDKTISTERRPLGGLIVGDFIYVYCEGGSGGVYAFGVHKYRISTETLVDTFLNPEDMLEYIGQESNALVVDAPYISVAWGAGHKVFDTVTETYLADAP